MSNDSSNEALWYQDAIIYELHIRAFCDSNADGIGDFPGLTSRLAYLKGLGVTALWLLPFYPSPLRDDGYDIADYLSINPAYGNLNDFKRFLRAAHDLGLKVITELVVNHTSNEHAWFQRARRAPPDSKARNYYVWSDDPKRYGEARIIFKDFEVSNWTWDPIAQAYYWHRFYSHQPDLNFENPLVHEALFKVVDFWFELGVDGMRLDAVPYLYEAEGTNCENLEETHAFLRKLRAHVDGKFANRMLLAEANQWPEDAATYFGKGDECHMNFHFPLMPRMFMAIQLEDSFPIIDILDQTPAIPANCQWATFLRNHDELTLEMVTDEDRDYMYRMYAADPRARINLGIRRRLTPLLGLRRKVELMNCLLFALPGTPVLYYGDEIGMGDNIYLGDRNGVRTPMQWSGDRNAGFSRANPQSLYFPVIIDPEYHYEAINVEAQESNPSSLLWWMKRLIALRKRYKALSRGSLEILHPDNNKVLAFVRSWQDQHMLVVANLSRFAQHAELDLQSYAGRVPVEPFGRQIFPKVTPQGYSMTLGPHSFLWFLLEPDRTEEEHTGLEHHFEFTGSWPKLLLTDSGRALLREVLPDYLVARRWFRSKTRTLKSVAIVDAIAVEPATGPAFLTVIEAEYSNGEAERYVLPLALLDMTAGQALARETPQAIVSRISLRAPGQNREGLICDAVYLPAFLRGLYDMFGPRKEVKGLGGLVKAVPSRYFKQRRHALSAASTITVLGVEQSNTSVVYDEAFVLKLFRRLDAGINPDVEVGRFLTETSPFEHVPSIGGELQYQTSKQTSTLAALQAYCPNHGNAWRHTLESLDRFFDSCLSLGRPPDTDTATQLPLLDRANLALPADLTNAAGAYFAQVMLLGQRTAELHRALSTNAEHPDFAPEPFTKLHQRSLYQATRTQMKRALRLLHAGLPSLPEDGAANARLALQQQELLDQRLRDIADKRIEVVKIRCHGDYHLGQVLYTGKDFFILDFEGEPGRPLAQRRFKRCSLRDVAGMLRSFDYAMVSALRHEGVRVEDLPAIRPWAVAWRDWASATFLRGYLQVLEGTPLLPAKREDRVRLLDFYLMEKCLYELEYELNNRPAWVEIPVLGLLDLLGIPATPPRPPDSSA